MDEERLISTGFKPDEDDAERSLRPRTLAEYFGQQKVKDSLSVYMQAAVARREPLDHILLYGPPGLGKTTLAGIIANEMGVNIRVTSGPAIEKQGDLAALLTNLQEGDVLFIDEIHRLNRSVEEVALVGKAHWRGLVDFGAREYPRKILYFRERAHEVFAAVSDVRTQRQHYAFCVFHFM